MECSMVAEPRRKIMRGFGIPLYKRRIYHISTDDSEKQFDLIIKIRAAGGQRFSERRASNAQPTSEQS